MPTNETNAELSILDEKICLGCAKSFPLSEFPKTGLHQRSSNLCGKCRKREQVEAVIKRKTAKEIAEFHQSIGKLAQPINAPHISEFLESLLVKFGGSNGFAQFYYDQVVLASVNDPGGKKVLDACRSITNIIQASTIHRATAPDVTSLSDDQLRTEKMMLLLQMVAEDQSNETLEMVMGFIKQEAGVVIDSEQGTPTTTD
jgi:hypothetical protein